MFNIKYWAKRFETKYFEHDLYLEQQCGHVIDRIDYVDDKKSPPYYMIIYHNQSDGVAVEDNSDKQNESNNEFTMEEFMKELDICIRQDGHDIYLKTDSAIKVKNWLK